MILQPQLGSNGTFWMDRIYGDTTITKLGFDGKFRMYMIDDDTTTTKLGSDEIFQIDLQPVFIQNQLIHALLLREVLSDKDDEILVKVNNTRLHFGLREFALITSVEKTMLNLPAFEHVPEEEEIHKDANFPLARNPRMKHSAVKSSDELRLLRRDYKLLNNEEQRDSRDEDHNDRDGLDKSKNSKIDDLSGPTEEVDEGMKEGDQVVDDAVDGCVKVGDDVVDDAVDGGKISGDEVDWSVVPDAEFSKFTQSDSAKNNMTMDEVDNLVKSVTEAMLDDHVLDNVADECVKVGDDVDWSTVPDVKFSKFTQSDSVKNIKVVEEVDNVVKGMPEAVYFDHELGFGKSSRDELQDYVGDHVEEEERNVMEEPRKCGGYKGGKNVGEAYARLGNDVILDDTPIVPRRPRKQAKACDLPYMTNFEYGDISVQTPVVPSNEHIFLINHPSQIIIESAIDFNLTKKYNNFITRSLRVKENSSDGILAVDSFEIRMGLWCFAATFSEYFIEVCNILKGVNDIDAIWSRYSIFLWDYEKMQLVMTSLLVD
ncbi:hypothetical protein RND71_042252 [Anisodus tanguticus]|uniref:Uncharacterized protein n=1 Tax=Anisodus tanguticus TaxID=243964 RepID=A0AAE1UUF9_9SOLA|nr:hypothetical protein RND71_042252 [Anisodus tanguticus]